MAVWINYHHLFYFKTIAEEGSVSAAAAKLLLGQPTLSAQLKHLEESLGVVLFERQKKKLILTEQGKIALEYAKQIFSMGNEMYEVLNDKIVPDRIQLQIGALDIIPKQIILNLAQKAYAIEKCKISLMEGHADDIFRELLAHRLDLVVTNFIPTSSGINKIKYNCFSSENIHLYGSPKYRKYQKSFPTGLAGLPVILPTFASRMRNDFEHWSLAQQLQFDVIAETQDISLQKLMVLEGLGLMPAARHTVQPLLDAKKMIEVGPLHGMREELYLVSADRKIKNPLAAELMKTFK